MMPDGAGNPAAARLTRVFSSCAHDGHRGALVGDFSFKHEMQTAWTGFKIPSQERYRYETASGTGSCSEGRAV